MPSSFGGEARVVADSLSIGRAMISMAEIQPDALIPCGELCDIQMENGFCDGAASRGGVVRAVPGAAGAG